MSFLQAGNRPPHFTTSTASNRQDAAKEAKEHASVSFCVFCDGSRCEHGVGAAAVAQLPGNRLCIRRIHLGPKEYHSIYDGELAGVILALDIVASESYLNNATILTDSQQVIRSLVCRGPRRSPELHGRYSIERFYSTLGSLFRQHSALKLHIAWVPGHMGIEGNECADREAKVAATGVGLSLVHCRRSLVSLRVQGTLRSWAN